MKKPTMLVVLDGWGERAERDYNAIALANTPVWDELTREYPYVQLAAHGEDVGLPAGLMGNSEVGHLNLGAGRIVWQDLTRISRAIRDGSFFQNRALVAAARQARDNGGGLHLIGLVSDGGVHSSPEHYYALLALAKREGMPAERVFFHALTDGRDTPPKSGVHHVGAVVQKMREVGGGVLASICGRYWAMDRDKRWERVEKAWRCLVLGEGVREREPAAAIARAYERGETDEFIKPIKLVDAAGQPLGLFRDGDAVIFFNFRGDRPRELIRALSDDEFGHFQRPLRPRLSISTMCEYEKGLKVQVAFASSGLPNIMADVLAANALTQFHTAETEKYAHVTFFFNGGVEAPWPGEDRLLIPSPKVATYDLQPEMSAPEVARNAAQRIRSGRCDFIVLNFANCDMVGHTGVLEAAIKAVEAVDAGVGQVVEAVLEMGGRVLVTADHGNAEEMWDYRNNMPHTAHTTNPVPCVLVGHDTHGMKLRQGGRLADVAPTLLDLMGLDQPAQMTGQSLVRL